MRGLGGFVLLAGVGVGLFVYFPAPVDSGTTLQQATQALAARHSIEADTARAAATHHQPVPRFVAAGSRVGAFAPALSLVSPNSVAAMPALPVRAARIQKASLSPADGWATDLSPAVADDGALTPSDADARYRLIVDIQQNLKRAGCYPGRVNGAWTESTRAAMQEFTTRANATLPVEAPDYLLLTLLKSYNGRLCGGTETVEAKAPTAGSDRIAAAAPEVLPWKANAAQATTRLFTPLPSSAANTAPLPGRMAIGGPRDFQAAPQQPLIPGGTNVASAALDDGPSYSNPAAVAPTHTVAPKASRKVKKSGNWRRPSRGTPRYNLMLSLGGVY